MWHFFTPFYYKSLKHCFGYCDYVFITKRILIKDSCYLSTFSCCCNYILVDLKVSFLPISSQNCVIHSLWSDSHMKWFQTFSLTLFRLIQIISAWFNLFPLIVASEMSNIVLTDRINEQIESKSNELVFFPSLMHRKISPRSSFSYRKRNHQNNY